MSKLKNNKSDAGDVFTATQLVRVSYDEKSKNNKGGRTLINGDRLNFYQDPETGFSASAWKVGDKYYVAFAGTNPKSFADLYTDAALGLGSYPDKRAAFWATEPRLSTQWGQAKDFMRKMAEDYPGIRFTLAGHSLGGTLAQYVSDEPNVARVYAFNAPGLPGGGRIDDKVTHYLSEKSTTRVPFTSKEFQVFGEWIEGLVW